MKDLMERRTRTDQLLADLRHAERIVEEESENLTGLQSQYTASLQAQTVVQELAQATQTSAHQKIAIVVTRCLKTVFGEEGYEFKIDFLRKRGKTEAKLLFLRNGHKVNPIEAAGGGVVEVAALALRVACLLLAMPRRRKVLILDEPLAKLSKGYTGRVGQLILQLAEELDFQIIFSTHSQRLAVGKVIQIGEQA